MKGRKRSQPVAPASLSRAGGRFARALERRVHDFIRSQGLLRPGERVVAGVSGGPDSTALLLILAGLRPALGIHLAAAHFDHRLRGGRAAAADARYVRGLAVALALPLAIGRGEVREHAQGNRLSLEEAARELRYAFLAREAERLGAAGVVAVGHTAADQAETVLMHIVRGSGLDGLVGMRPRSFWPFGDGPALVRPLLGVGREESERYCRELGLRPRRDPSNLALEATRNRIRHQVLPLLRQLNPAVEEALLRLAAAAAEYVGDLDRQADALWPALAREGEGAVTFSRDALAGLAPALAARLLRRAARGLTGGPGALEAVHIQAMLEGLAKQRTRLALPGGLTFVVRGPSVRLALGGGERDAGAAPIPSTPLAVSGRTDLPGWTVEARLLRRPRSPRTASPFEAYLDAEAVGGELRVRSRRPGDRLRPLGLGGEKKVQDILVDAKVPAEERDAVPIVCAAWGVAWVVGHRLDERAAVGEGTRQALWLRFVARPALKALDTASSEVV